MFGVFEFLISGAKEDDIHSGYDINFRKTKLEKQEVFWEIKKSWFK